MFEGGDGFAAEAVELADGKNNGAFEVIVQIAKGERRAAEATELVAQALGGEGLVLGGGERGGRGGLSDVAVGIASDEGEGRADVYEPTSLIGRFRHENNRNHPGDENHRHCEKRAPEIPHT